MCNSNNKKTAQLGMPIGTASNRLRKSIIFKLLKDSGKNYCFQCSAEIENEKDLSIEHKIPYLDSDNPIDLFFDLDNIAFSHLSCNIGAARQTKTLAHPSQQAYKYGCRCKECTNENAKRVRKWRDNKK